VAYEPHVEGGDAHAGHTETSIVLALDASLVRHNERVPGVTAPLAALAATLRRDGVAAVSPNGVLGDPTTATRADGTALLATLSMQLERSVDATFGAVA